MKKLFFALICLTLVFSGCEKDEPVLEQEEIEAKIYTQVKINSITLTSYPLVKSNGASFDVFPSSGADITFQIRGVNPTNYVLYDHDRMYEDVSSVRNIVFTIIGGKTLQVINDFYFFRFLDYDGALNPDHIGDISFNPFVYTIGSPAYPTSFSRIQNGITATFDVTWQ